MTERPTEEEMLHSWRGSCARPGAVRRYSCELGRVQAETGFDEAHLLEAVARHRRTLEAGSSFVLKGVNRSRVTLVDDPRGDGRVVVEEEMVTRPWWRRMLAFWLPARPVQAFRVGRELLERGLPTPLPLAAAVDSETEYLVTRAIPESIDARRLLVGWSIGGLPDEAVLRAFAEQLGWWVRWLHDEGLYQGDFKVNNVLVRPRGRLRYHFHLLDLDRVFLWRRPTRRRRLKNLEQLGDVPRGITLRHCLRFLRAYLGPEGRGRLRGEARTIASMLEERRARRREVTPTVTTIDDYVRHQLEG